MPSRFVLKSMNAIHRTILTVTRERVGWRAGGMPVLKLTTTGRRTGERRTVMLTSPLREGSTWVLVASKGGDDDHPAWFLNLRANPQVWIDSGTGSTIAATARVADPSERSRMWPLITAKYANYAAYQRKTTREIPLVLIETER